MNKQTQGALCIDEVRTNNTLRDTGGRACDTKQSSQQRVPTSECSTAQHTDITTPRPYALQEIPISRQTIA